MITEETHVTDHDPRVPHPDPDKNPDGTPVGDQGGNA